MIVYEATKQLFVEDVIQDRIEENIDRKFYEKMGYNTSLNERKAWNNSHNPKVVSSSLTPATN